MTSFLIKGARGILTGLPADSARASGDIRVHDGVIAEIGALTPQPDEDIVDASGCVVTPGLVNTHHHLFQSVMKAAPQGMNESLAPWLRLVPYRYWDKIDEEALEVSVTIGLAELALSGVTTTADHHYLYSQSYDFDPNEKLFSAAQKFGMRFALCRGGATKGRTFDEDKTTPIPTETLDTMLRAVDDTAKRWHDASDDSIRRVVMAPTTPTFSLEESELREIASAARARGLRLHSHLSENWTYDDYVREKYGKRPIEWIAQHDWLGPDVWFAHLTTCDDNEVSLLAQTGAGMAHCPQPNARLGSGIAPAAKLSRMGGRVSIGVDGASANEAADMISAIYAAFTVNRAAHGANAVTAEELVSWATRGGADILGFDTLGVIAPGRPADIVLFDLNAPRYFGQHDALIGPFISGGQAHVRRSYVAGREIVRDGKLPWLDMEKLGADAARVVKRMAQASL